MMTDLAAARLQMEVSWSFHMIFAAVDMAMPLARPSRSSPNRTPTIQHP